MFCCSRLCGSMTFLNFDSRGRICELEVCNLCQTHTRAHTHTCAHTHTHTHSHTLLVGLQKEVGTSVTIQTAEILCSHCIISGAPQWYHLMAGDVSFLWLHWVFTAGHGLSLAGESRGCSWLWWADPRGWAFTSWGEQGLFLVVVGRPQRVGSAVVVHGLNCPTACGIFPDRV